MHRYDNIFGSESDTVGKSENYVQILTTPFQQFSVVLRAPQRYLRRLEQLIRYYEFIEEV